MRATIRTALPVARVQLVVLVATIAAALEAHPPTSDSFRPPPRQPEACGDGIVRDPPLSTSAIPAVVRFRERQGRNSEGAVAGWAHEIVDDAGMTVGWVNTSRVQETILHSNCCGVFDPVSPVQAARELRDAIVGGRLHVFRDWQTAARDDRRTSDFGAVYQPLPNVLAVVEADGTVHPVGVRESIQLVKPIFLAVGSRRRTKLFTLSVAIGDRRLVVHTLRIAHHVERDRKSVEHPGRRWTRRLDAMPWALAVTMRADGSPRVWLGAGSHLHEFALKHDPARDGFELIQASRREVVGRWLELRSDGAGGTEIAVVDPS